MTEPEIVEIEWLDAVIRDGWQELAEVPALAKCRSVGFLVVDNDDVKCLALTIGENDQRLMCASDIMVIPAKTVVWIKRLQPSS